MFTSRIHRSTGQATIGSFPRRRSFVATGAVAATVALLALTSGVAQAATRQYFPVSVSTSILAPNYASNASLLVTTTCNTLTHRGAVSLGVEVPTLLTSGLAIEVQVLVKNQRATTYNGSLYLAHQLVRAYPRLGFTDLIGSPAFVGAAGALYDVGVWYRYQRVDGQWTGWGFFQESLYSTVVNSWNNVLETTTCQT